MQCVQVWTWTRNVMKQVWLWSSLIMTTLRLGEIYFVGIRNAVIDWILETAELKSLIKWDRLKGRWALLPRNWVLTDWAELSCWVRMSFWTKLSYWAKLSCWVKLSCWLRVSCWSCWTKLNYWAELTCWIKLRYWVKLSCWIKLSCWVTELLRSKVNKRYTLCSWSAIELLSYFYWNTCMLSCHVTEYF